MTKKFLFHYYLIYNTSNFISLLFWFNFYIIQVVEVQLTLGLILPKLLGYYTSTIPIQSILKYTNETNI